jgi:hypothetical protein
MKKSLLTSALSFFGCFLFFTAAAQTSLYADQNPNFAVSRDKYMRMADSINQWHETTIQQTYKAYDWYEQREERRNERRQDRRDIRLERARNYGHYYQSYYYPSYRPSYYYRTPRHFRFWWY